MLFMWENSRTFAPLYENVALAIGYQHTENKELR